jgi:hypothetical protein
MAAGRPRSSPACYGVMHRHAGRHVCLFDAAQVFALNMAYDFA